MESEKRKKEIAEWIGQPLKPPSSKEDEGYEEDEEDVGANLSSTEDGSPGDKYDEGREDKREYDRKDTVL